MKKIKWTEVDEATYSDYLPRGGYVVKIVDVEDHPEWDALNIIFDVAEGEYKDKFADLEPDDNWKHRLRQNYGGKSERFFKGFLTALEKSNPGFSIERWQQRSNETELIGLKFGALITYSFTVGDKGNVSKNYRLDRAVPIDMIRSGKYELRDDYYSPEAEKLIAEQEAEKSQGASGDPFEEEIPF